MRRGNLANLPHRELGACTRAGEPCAIAAPLERGDGRVEGRAPGLDAAIEIEDEDLTARSDRDAPSSQYIARYARPFAVTPWCA